MTKQKKEYFDPWLQLTFIQVKLDIVPLGNRVVKFNVVFDQGIVVAVVVVIFRPDAIFYDLSLMGNSKKQTKVYGHLISQLCK